MNSILDPKSSRDADQHADRAQNAITVSELGTTVKTHTKQWNPHTNSKLRTRAPQASQASAHNKQARILHAYARRRHAEERTPSEGGRAGWDGDGGGRVPYQPGTRRWRRRRRSRRGSWRGSPPARAPCSPLLRPVGLLVLVEFPEAKAWTISTRRAGVGEFGNVSLGVVVVVVPWWCGGLASAPDVHSEAWACRRDIRWPVIAPAGESAGWEHVSSHAGVCPCVTVWGGVRERDRGERGRGRSESAVCLPVPARTAPRSS
jgi:hypothetical protein